MEIQLKDRISHGFSLIDQFTKYFSSLDISAYQYYKIIDKYIWIQFFDSIFWKIIIYSFMKLKVNF